MAEKRNVLNLKAQLRRPVYNKFGDLASLNLVYWIFRNLNYYSKLFDTPFV